MSQRLLVKTPAGFSECSPCGPSETPAGWVAEYLEGCWELCAGLATAEGARWRHLDTRQPLPPTHTLTTQMEILTGAVQDEDAKEESGGRTYNWTLCPHSSPQSAGSRGWGREAAGRPFLENMRAEESADTIRARLYAGKARPSAY